MNNKFLTYSLIITFGILYFCTAFVSFYHAIEFFQLANEKWLSIILSLVAEIGQASVLFSLLTAKDKNKFLPWFIMFILTALQIIGNVFSCYSFIEEANSPKFLYFQKSILFFLEESPDVMKVVVAWIIGSILPIIALSMTSLVEKNLQDLYDFNTNSSENNDKVKDDNNSNVISPEIPSEETTEANSFKNDIKPIFDEFDKVIEDASTYKPNISAKVNNVEIVPV